MEITPDETECTAWPVGPVTRVRVGAIAIGDERYRITTGDPDEALRVSVGRRGCLTPPICHQTEGALVPVAGFKRLRACLETFGSQALVEVRVVPRETPPLEVLSIAACDARRDDQIRPFLVYRTIRRALDLGVDREAIGEHLLVELGQEPHASVIERHLRLGQIPVPLAEILEDRGVSLRRGLRFVGISEESGGLLARLADLFQLNGRALEVWTTMIAQVARRDGLTWHDVAERAELWSLAEQHDRQLDQRVQQGHDKLWALRYPTWHEARATARQRVRQVGLPERMEVIWDDRFESDGFTLSITVRDPRQLQGDLESLLEPERIRRIGELLEAL